MIAAAVVSICALLAPPVMNAEGWDAGSRTPEAIATGTKALERAAEACRALGDRSVVETVATRGVRETLRWESRANARAWSFRADRGIEVVGIDGDAFVTVDALPGQVALVECGAGCRAAFLDAGVVLPVMATVRRGSSLGEAGWEDDLPGAVVAGSRTTKEGTQVLVIDASAGGDVLIDVDGTSGLPTRIRVVQRLPAELSHPALGPSPVLERTWTGAVREARPDPIAISTAGRTMAASLPALLDQLDPVRRRVPPPVEPAP